MVLSPLTSVCAIYCYYSTGGPTDLCMSCAISTANVDLRPVVYIIRRHEVDTWDGIRGRWCTNCRSALYVIFPCNMCPICSERCFELLMMRNWYSLCDMLIAYPYYNFPDLKIDWTDDSWIYDEYNDPWVLRKYQLIHHGILCIKGPAACT
ncbi:hypothetical protein DMN91_000604 [Ooceraea biroi]|uniref:Uncharacterized protein n=1 Tax=Ooceraea biroi TaxID=2015173 RepID=A0A3L8E2A7_OOCBI|nr:hypothetical protein DMN91_000604 [Ooceraea biroi]